MAAGIAEFGKIDILIANAGIWTLGSFWELTVTIPVDAGHLTLTGYNPASTR